MSLAPLWMVFFVATVGGQDQPSLKELVKRLQSDATQEERRAALTEIALLPQDEKQPRKDIAEALARGLEDPSIQLRGEAVRLLMLGQHREVALKAVIEALEAVRTDLGKLSKARGRGTPNPGEESVTRRFDELIQYTRTLCAALGRLPDDRAVGALDGFTAKIADGLRARFAETVARSLTQLGTRDAWKGAVALLPVLEGKAGRKHASSAGAVDDARRSSLRRAHDVLVGAARGLGHDDVPEWSDKPSSDWRDWVKRHQGDVPAKLGRVSPAAHDD